MTDEQALFILRALLGTTNNDLVVACVVEEIKENARLKGQIECYREVFQNSVDEANEEVDLDDLT